MSFEKIIEKLKEERIENNKSELINKLEEELSRNPKILSKTLSFFELPLNQIFSVLSKVNFNENEEDLMKDMIKNTLKAHNVEKETILLLQNLNFDNFSLSFEELIEILGYFNNCSFLVHLCESFNEQNTSVDFDYEYELEEKDKEIQKLKQQIFTKDSPSFDLIEFPPITEKPKDYEEDILKACRDGKLSSVQWLLEKEGCDKNKKDKYGNLPIHYASRFGHLSIVQYLIEKQNVDKDAKGWKYTTPLHKACIGHLNVVQYLISKGADIDAQDADLKTPLHVAAKNGNTDIVKYLISKGANKAPKDFGDRKPYDWAANNEIKQLLI